MPVVTEIPGIPTGFESITPTTAKSITSALVLPTSGSYIAMNAVAAYVTVETQPIRFRIDGTAASATVGHSLGAGESYLVRGKTAVSQFSCIDTAAGAATVRVTVFHPFNSDLPDSGP